VSVTKTAVESMVDRIYSGAVLHGMPEGTVFDHGVVDGDMWAELRTGDNVTRDVLEIAELDVSAPNEFVRAVHTLATFNAWPGWRI
jgi:hypothetical protein